MNRLHGTQRHGSTLPPVEGETMTEHDLSGAPLLIRDETGAWRTPETSRFDNEGGLQDLVASNPSLLPLVGEGAVTVREFRTASGPLDVCIVDQSGGVTLVECKLASNPEVRRKIVGQVLDYAARIWRLDFADFDERWRNQNGGVGVLAALGLDSTDEVQGTIATALERGEFNLVLAVDEINEPLRHLVEYLNSHTSDSTAVLAVEFRYFRRNDVEVLVPSVYGTESAQAKAGRRRRDAWSVEEYEEYVSVHEPASLSTVRELFNKLVEAGFDLVGSSSATPSLVTRSDWNGRKSCTV